MIWFKKLQIKYHGVKQEKGRDLSWNKVSTIKPINGLRQRSKYYNVSILIILCTKRKIS